MLEASLLTISAITSDSAVDYQYYFRAGVVESQMRPTPKIV
jgi:hypothetical protein